MDLLDLERQPGPDVAEELDRGLLVRARVDPQDAQAGAVIDRGVLVELPPALVGAGGDRLDELDVDLQLVARTLFLVALPPLLVALVALRSGQAVHAQAFEDAVDRRGSDLDVVVATQIHLDLQLAEVVVLPRMDNLLDHLGVGDGRAVQRGALERSSNPSEPQSSQRRVSTGRRCCRGSRSTGTSPPRSR
ncbi:hypothetical protein [Amycolatopsis sp. FDAARGOS 1241]|uniref:hypothetical protein n=1 Tax=Amycolatopsis sp. FDAARGOS 1241 TaxID=2778070 RepID=UPI00194F8DD5|nr:hypothetical protein [Amycolatopsis sp. FDAARGOS 1241]QRP45450.1 hypothetical protein I6J71_40995 [Amycolatopsis sp. FDAARGOS 1241]